MEKLYHSWYETGKIEQREDGEKHGQIKYEQIPYEPARYWDIQGHPTDEEGNLIPDDTNNGEAYNQTPNQEAINYLNNYKKEHPDQFINDGNPSETYNQFVGENAVEKLEKDGRYFALGNAETLEKAKSMDAIHMPAGYIWRSTGWIKGKDGKWRTEILDGNLNDSLLKGKIRKFFHLKDVYSNDALFSAYPDLADMWIDVKPIRGSTRAYYSPTTKSITINRKSIKNGEFSDLRLDLIHEIQHAIQDIEGWESGSTLDNKEEAKLRRKINKLLKHPNKEINGQLFVVDFTWAFADKNNPKDVALLEKRIAKMTEEARAVWQQIQELRSQLPDAERKDFEIYKRSAGEVEARNAETRSDWDMDKRRSTPPTDSEDTPRSQQTLSNSSETYKQILGRKAATALDKRNSNTWLTDNLDIAKAMTKAGETPAKIRIATGWELGTDGEWKYEIQEGNIDTHALRIALRQNAGNIPFSITLRTLYNNEELFKAYPELIKLRVEFTDKLEPDTLGFYEHDIIDPSKSYIAIGIQKNTKAMQSTLIHEIQHAVQFIEGFAEGGYDFDALLDGDTAINIAKKELKYRLNNTSTNMRNVAELYRKGYYNMAMRKIASFTPYEDLQWKDIKSLIDGIRDGKVRLRAYSYLGGEVEARNAQAREPFSPEKRRRTLLADTQDESNWLVSKKGVDQNFNIIEDYSNNTSYDSFLTPEKYNQLMHHGTKNELIGNRFNLRYLSSGEGHQAFGYGAYLAEEIRVGEGYRKAGMSQLDLADTIFIMKDGSQKAPNEIIVQLSKIVDELKKHDIFKDGKRDISRNLAEYIDSHVKAIRIGIDLQYLARNKTINGYSSIEEVVDYNIKKILDEVNDDVKHGKYTPRIFLKIWNNGGEKIFRELIAPFIPVQIKTKTPSKGNIYLFEGPDNDILLDWDVDMEHQPPKVLEAIKKGNLYRSKYETGEQLYKRLSRQLGSDMLASMKLNELGIPGHRFWDEFSRKTQSGTHNFVIWNTDTLRLLGITEDSEQDAQDFYRAEDYSNAYLDSLDNDSDVVDYDSRDYDYDMAHIDDIANTHLDALDNNGFYETYKQTANSTNLDNNSARTINSFLTPEAKKQVDALRKKYQGTDTWMKAPNGEPSNLDELQWLLVRTPNFKRWFGDWENNPLNASKVIDKNGEPRVVYHGTPKGNTFSIFENNTQGIHFGTWNAAYERVYALEHGYDGMYSEEEDIDEDYLNGFSDLDDDFEADILECFLNIRKPKRTEDVSDWRPVIQKAKEKGFDGLVYKNTAEDYGSDSWVIFSPNHVKSATRNNGEYSLSNDEIYKQIIGEYGAGYIDLANHNDELIDNLAIAQEITHNGKSPKEIKLATGWELGHDGKWRYEIMDGKLINRAIQSNRKSFMLHEIFNAPELFNAYKGLILPDGETGIAGMRVQFKDLDSHYYAFFDKNTFSIEIQSYLKNEPEKLRSVLIHELQHAIQYIEEFATGGSGSTGDRLRRMANIWALSNEIKETAKEHPELENKHELIDILRKEYEDGFTDAIPEQDMLEDAFEIYRYGDKNGAFEYAYNLWDKGAISLNDNPYDYSTAQKLAGEVEARNAQRRMNWTEEQRRNNTLAETEDIKAYEQIVMENYYQTASPANSEYGNSLRYEHTLLTPETKRQIAAVRDKYKGTTQWLKAPNGKRTNLTQTQWLLVRTPNFKRWFGDWENSPAQASKILDKNGEPLVVFHQTNRKQYINKQTDQNWDDLSIFEKHKWEKRDDWDNFWQEKDFSIFDRRYARHSAEIPAFFFSSAFDNYHEYGKRTIAAFLNIRNPARNPHMPQLGQYNEAGIDAMNSLIEQGYDGVINDWEEAGVPYEIAAFYPNQIKSATRNNGEYSLSNDEIYKQTTNSQDNEQTFYGIDADGRQLLLRFNPPELDAVYEKYKKVGTLFLAPNGNKSNLDNRAWLMVRTPAFKNWFGDWENDPLNASKVLDENGEPLIVVHFTDDGGFSVFNTNGKFAFDSYKTKGTGAWFADLKGQKIDFTAKDEGTNIYHVFLNIHNPYIYNAEGRHWSDLGRIWIGDENGGNPIYYDQDGKPFLYDYQAREYIRTVLRSNPRYYYVHEDKYPTTDDLTRAVRKGKLGNRNHDGVIIRNVDDLGYTKPIDDYVIFKPIQVKSQFNRGSFCNDNTDVYKQTAAERDMDRKYFDALNAGDMDTARSIVDEQARRKGYSTNNGHRMRHQPANTQNNSLVETYRQSARQLDTFSNTRSEADYRRNLQQEKPKSAWQKIKQSLRDIAKGFKSDFSLLTDKKFIPAREILRIMNRNSNAKAHMAMVSMYDALHGLNAEQFNIFSRVMLLNDIYSFKRHNPNASLPLHFTAETLQADKNKFVELAKRDKKIMNALMAEDKNNKKARQDLINLANELGFKSLAAKLQANDMFLIQYADLLGKPEISSNDFNTNYVIAVGTTRTMLLNDFERMLAVKKLQQKGYDKKAELIQKFGTDKNTKYNRPEWMLHIPKGYSIFNPLNGEFISSAHSLTENIMAAALDDAAELLGLSEDTMAKLREKIAEPFDTQLMVLPNELTLTLKNLSVPNNRTPLGHFAKTITNGWKKYVLYFPTRVWKYMFRNITGDLDALLTGDPTAVRFIPQAFSDLSTAYYGDMANVSDELKEFQARGGAITIESAQELGDYKQFREFNNLIKELEGKDASAWKKLPRSAWNLIDKFTWSGIQRLSDFREQLLRYAAYLDYLHQTQNNTNGMPNNWGASKKDEVMSIDDIRDRAFKMANELLGAYDQVSETGKQLRDMLIPFYSWMEVNAKRYLQLLKNGITEDVAGDFASKYLKGHFANAPYFAYKVSKTMLFISLFSLLVKAFNHLFWPDDEEKLPPEIADRPHITLGHDKDGNVLYFSQIGSLFDFLDWFGLDTFKHDVKQIFNGQMTVTDWIKHITSAPFKKLVNGLNPFYKTTFEIGSGMSFFPDFTKPRRTKDIFRYLAQSLGLAWPYKTVTGEKLNHWREFKNIFIYSQDANLSAYYYSRELVRQFKENVYGETSYNDSSSPKGDALRRMKNALRSNDKETVIEALNEYYLAGGNDTGLKQSLNSLNPLFGLNEERKQKFRAWLSDDERTFLDRAEKYSEKLLMDFKKITEGYTPPVTTQQNKPKKKSSGKKSGTKRIKPQKTLKQLKPPKLLKF